MPNMKPFLSKGERSRPATRHNVKIGDKVRFCSAPLDYYIIDMRDTGVLLEWKYKDTPVFNGKTWYSIHKLEKNMTIILNEPHKEFTDTEYEELLV